MDEPSPRRDGGGMPLPQPDPTAVTTAQIEKAVTNLHDLMQSELRGMERVRDEKFDSVNTRLDQGEAQRVEQKIDTRLAVDAALAAAKEAVKEQTAAFALATAKSEAGTAEQLKQLSVTFTAAIGNLTSALDELKDRVGRIENIKLGSQEARTSQANFVGFIIGAVGATAGIVATVMALIP